MSTDPTPNPKTGWGEALPLPLTPKKTISAATAGTATASDTRATVRNAEAVVSESGNAIELGGPAGPDPTRYNDWEQKGRCSDF